MRLLEQPEIRECCIGVSGRGNFRDHTGPTRLARLATARRPIFRYPGSDEWTPQLRRGRRNRSGGAAPTCAGSAAGVGMTRRRFRRTVRSRPPNAGQPPFRLRRRLRQEQRNHERRREAGAIFRDVAVGEDIPGGLAKPPGSADDPADSRKRAALDIEHGHVTDGESGRLWSCRLTRRALRAVPADRSGSGQTPGR